MRGHIRKRSKDKDSWTLVIDLGRDENGKRKQKWITVKGTKKEAEKILAETIAKIEKGDFIADEKQTLGEFLGYWLEEVCRPKLAPKTFKSYRDTIRLHVAPALGDMPLTKLKPPVFQKYYNQKLEEGLSKTTVSYHHRVLNTALKKATQWQLIEKNPLENVSPPGKEYFVPETLTFEEAQKLLQAAKDEPYYLPFLLAIYTGMRVGEISGLTWDCYDAVNQVITVKQALQRQKGGLVIVPTKTKQKRQIPITGDLPKELKKQKLKQNENKLLWGIDYHSGNFICTWDDGRPFDPGFLSKKVKNLLTKAGINKNIRFHDLRHTHATLLLEMNVHPKIVSERLGHADISTTLNIYSHVNINMQRLPSEELQKKISS